MRIKPMIYLILSTFYSLNLFAQSVSEPSFIDFRQYSNITEYSYSSVRIWGWSRDSKVAYSNNKDIEGRGGSIITVAIFDLINDTILWKNSLDTFSFWGEDYLEQYNIAYDNFILDFINICGQNKIEFIQTEFLNMPIRHNTQTVNITIEKINRSNSDEYDLVYWGRIGSYKIIAENQGRRKTIHEKTFSRAAVDVFVCGYFISPFENRALVVVGELIRVFEGYGIDEYVLIGCHLSEGFR
jgi:hypothetical protein